MTKFQICRSQLDAQALVRTAPTCSVPFIQACVAGLVMPTPSNIKVM